ncbi:MAG: GH3 auxin-responsive promoter family protein [Bacteroidales bacterium]|nr:GH3 auxin-responsive promoter family protein [Bacteroidales bacterium]
MLNFTPIGRKILAHRATDALKAARSPETNARAVLDWLLSNGRRTKWGREQGLADVKTYEEYSRQVPVREYEDFRPYAMRMIQGEADVLWPGVTRRFAQSSGTSGGKSKFIPITADALKHNHYYGAGVSVSTYLSHYPESRLFGGKAFILGGSYANELHLPQGVYVGDLSATLIDDVSPVINLFRTPSKDIGLMKNWEEKLPLLVEASIKEDVTNLSGVPSWFLTVLKHVLQRTGASTVQDVWPHLEVFFYGGISFKPYRMEYEKIMSPSMRYWQTYNASEGFFACQSEIGDEAMLLIQNAGVFYEFVPIDEIGTPSPRAVPIWEVQKGKTYALVITSPNGLWRYMIGDTVTIESLDPVKISIAGRTNSFINVFGEEVMVYNTDAAIEKTCAAMGCAIANYTAAPVYAEGQRKGRHQWLIEWDTPPADPATFAAALDKALQKENSDYQAKRQGGIFLDPLEVISAPAGLFDRWLELTGKLGGQRKVPRLRNDRQLIDQLLELMKNEK